MHRIDTVRLTISTGAEGHDEPVRIAAGGALLELHRISGGTRSGETMVGEHFLGCRMASLELLAPERSAWSIRELEIQIRTSEGREFIRRLQRMELPPSGRTTLDLLRPDDLSIEV